MANTAIKPTWFIIDDFDVLPVLSWRGSDLNLLCFFVVGGGLVCILRCIVTHSKVKAIQQTKHLPQPNKYLQHFWCCVIFGCLQIHELGLLRDQWLNTKGIAYWLIACYRRIILPYFPYKEPTSHWYCWLEEIPFPTTVWMVLKPLYINNGIFSLPTSTGEWTYRISGTHQLCEAPTKIHHFPKSELPASKGW